MKDKSIVYKKTIIMHAGKSRLVRLCAENQMDVDLLCKVVFVNNLRYCAL